MVDASDHRNCRLSLSRAEERLGVVSLKSLIIIVEMKSDFWSGYSSKIRTTNRKVEYLFVNKFFKRKEKKWFTF